MNLPGDTKGWREGWSEMGDGESGGKKRGGGLFCSGKMWHGGSVPDMSTRCQCLSIRFVFPAKLFPNAY